MTGPAPDPLDLFDRCEAALCWLAWVGECDRFELIARACLGQIVDPAQGGLDGPSLSRAVIGSDAAVDRLNDAMIAVRSMLREDDTPIQVRGWVVYLNDRGNPAYTAAIPSRKEAVPC